MIGRGKWQKCFVAGVLTLGLIFACMSNAVIAFATEGKSTDTAVDIGATIEALYKTLDELRLAVTKQTSEEVQSELIAAIDEIEDTIVSIDVVIKGAVNGTVENVAEELERAMTKLRSAADTLIKIAEGDNNDAIEAMRGTYAIAENSCYVSIGDASVVSDPETMAYTYKLANYLQESYELDLNAQFVQTANIMLEYSELETILDNISSEINRADLISVGIGNCLASDFVVKQVRLAMAGKVAEEMDWTVFVGEDGLTFVDQALEDFNRRFIESGLSEQYASIITLAIESYAYAYMHIAASYPVIIQEIHEINPNALVLLVGMYNPMEGLVLTNEGMELNLGDYIQNFVDVTNIEMLSCAMLMDNTVFISAPDVDTNMGAETQNALQFLTTLLVFGTENMHATEIGHEYIKNQIINAISFSEKEAILLGDVSGDGIVNMADVTAIRRYLVSRELYPLIIKDAGDVTEDGSINMADVTAIRRYLLSNEMYPLGNDEA